MLKEQMAKCVLRSENMAQCVVNAKNDSAGERNL